MGTWLRRTLLLTLVAMSGCAFTDWNRFQDQVQAARADLHSPEMLARICAAGAMTRECGWTGR